MHFPLVGTGKRLTLADYKAVADRYDLPVSHVRAVAKVEAAGSGWAGGNLIKALYEGHVMYRASDGAVRSRLVKAGLAWRKWNRKRYRSGTRAQHDQIQGAVKLAGDRGYQAASYGLGQVLGENAKMCGFTSSEAMVQHNLKGEAEQLDTMMRFCRGANLFSALKSGQWATFARRYNGPGYKKNRYDTKLAAAARLYRRSPADGLTDSGNIKTVTKNPKQSDPNVKEAQVALNTLIGAGLEVDGWPGPATRDAVLQFQRTHPDLANDGLIGPQTLAALDMALKYKAAKPAQKSAKTKSVSTGVLAAAGGAVATVAGASWQIGIALAALGVVVLGVWLFMRWRHNRRFDQEIAHEANETRGQTIPVDGWAGREHEFAR